MGKGTTLALIQTILIGLGMLLLEFAEWAAKVLIACAIVGWFFSL